MIFHWIFLLCIFPFVFSWLQINVRFESWNFRSDPEKHRFCMFPWPTCEEKSATYLTKRTELSTDAGKYLRWPVIGCIYNIFLEHWSIFKRSKSEGSMYVDEIRCGDEISCLSSLLFSIVFFLFLLLLFFLFFFFSSQKSNQLLLLLLRLILIILLLLFFFFFFFFLLSSLFFLLSSFFFRPRVFLSNSQ